MPVVQAVHGAVARVAAAGDLWDYSSAGGWGMAYQLIFCGSSTGRCGPGAGPKLEVHTGLEDECDATVLFVRKSAGGGNEFTAGATGRDGDFGSVDAGSPN